MQWLRITIGKHIELKRHQPFRPAGKQLGREGTTALVSQRISLIHGYRPEKLTLNTEEGLRS
jgi:hypothetical protein